MDGALRLRCGLLLRVMVILYQHAGLYEVRFRPHKEDLANSLGVTVLLAQHPPKRQQQHYQHFLEILVSAGSFLELSDILS